MHSKTLAKRQPIFAERTLTIACGEDLRTFHLSKGAQVLGVAGLAFGLGWAMFASATTLASVFSGPQMRVVQNTALNAAYDTHITDLKGQLDLARQTSADLEGRLALAKSRLQDQQSQVLELGSQRANLDAALEASRQSMAEAIGAHADLAARHQELEREMAALSGALNEGSGSREDLQDTLSVVTDALDSAVEIRDTALAERTEMEMKLAGLELRMQVSAERQDRMVTQLEEAVEMSFGPLEQMFDRVGLDVDSLVSQVRRSYSGVGGSGLPVAATSAAFDDPELQARYASLVEGMDKMNLLRIAANKVPYAMPVTASHRFTSGFGTRRDPVTGGRRAHNGLDFAAPLGTQIKTSADGVVVFAGRQRGFGNLIKVRHAFGFETLYAHLNKIHVKVGDRVSRGEHIGDMGTTGRSTGVHLHYEVRIGGKPVNPMTYIKAARDVL
ncbi:MAG: DUF5930 domain-containing protein [Pseudomonadota bacterium]